LHDETSFAHASTASRNRPHFNSLPNRHNHFHVLALDRVLSSEDDDGVRFQEATDLEAHHAETLARMVQSIGGLRSGPRAALSSSNHRARLSMLPDAKSAPTLANRTTRANRPCHSAPPP